MKALHCLAEAFTWLFRPGIRRYILLPLAVNIILFTAGSYAAWHYSTTLIDRLLPDWLAWLDWLLYPLIGLTLLILTYATFALMANLIAAPFNSLLAAAVVRHRVVKVLQCGAPGGVGKPEHGCQWGQDEGEDEGGDGEGEEVQRFVDFLYEAREDVAPQRLCRRFRFAALGFFDGGSEQAVKRCGDEVRHQAEAVVGEDEQGDGKERVEQPVQPGKPARQEAFNQRVAVVKGGVTARGEQGDVHRKR